MTGKADPDGANLMMLANIGERIYYDWRLVWDLMTMPHQIDCYNPNGIHQWRISGLISQERLKRELKHFYRDHSPQQMVMAL